MNVRKKRWFEWEERRNFLGVYGVRGLRKKVESGVRVWSSVCERGCQLVVSGERREGGDLGEELWGWTQS